MVLWYTLVTLRTGKGTGMFTENTVWKAVERLINANADNGQRWTKSVRIRLYQRIQ